MKNIEYNHVLGAFKDFFNRHLQVNQVVDAQTWDFQAVENKYPAVILVPTLSNIYQGELQLNFEIYFVDILLADNSNGRDVYNDTLEIVKDFVSYFTNNPMFRWSLTEDCTVEPLWERFDDICAGWVLSCNVRVPYGKGTCEIPLSE